MDNGLFNNTNVAGMGMYGDAPTYYAGQGTPMNYVPAQMPQNNNALSEEEIKHIMHTNPNKLDINISPDDNLRAICTHKKNGIDMVRPVNDGSDDVYCPICNARWSSKPVSNEELHESINTVISQMQNAKWLGDLNTSLVRDYMPMIPLLYKFNDIFPYAMNNFNRYVNQGGYRPGDDAGLYSTWNNIMGTTPAYPMNNMMYNQPMMNNQMMQQPVMNNGYYGQNNQYMNNNAAAMMQGASSQNPMQLQMGVDPNAMNTQFVNQANNMMGGTVYGNMNANYGVQQPMMNNQNMAAQNNQQAAQAAPNQTAAVYKPGSVAAEAAQQSTPKTEKTETKVDL